MVASITRRSEELRLHKAVYNLTISNPGLKIGILKCISLLNCSVFWVMIPAASYQERYKIQDQMIHQLLIIHEEQ
jgi:hypothetical protein